MLLNLFKLCFIIVVQDCKDIDVVHDGFRILQVDATSLRWQEEQLKIEIITDLFMDKTSRQIK